ncbi:MAG: glycosyltransferase family 2 protein [Anaerolineales bacterium]|nr:glycosyltransferase family 2 protein [Anaerolineales bacterium]
MPTLTVCLIVKNEESDLPRCLTSVRALASEIVVADTGSTDRTVEIARGLGARVIDVPWTGDFSAARNAGLEAATGDWILIIDADEEVPVDAHAQFRDLLDAADRAQPPIDAYVVVCHSFLPPGEPLAFTDHPTLRLFRNRPIYRFRQAIHEQILPAIYDSGGRVQRVEARINHYGYARAEAQGGVSRNQRDRQILEAALAAQPENLDLTFQLGALALREGRASESETLLRRAADSAEQLGPVERALTFLFLSTLALQRGDPDAALLAADASLQASTSSSPTQARLNRAQALLLLGQAAAERASQALQPGLPAEAYGRALQAIQESRRLFALSLETYTELTAAADLAPALRLHVENSRRLCQRLLA